MRATSISLLVTALAGAAIGIVACSFGPPVYNGPNPPPAPTAADNGDSGGGGDDGGGSDDGGAGDDGSDDGSAGDDGGGSDDASTGDDGGGDSGSVIADAGPG
jgi:hypothetical protein